MLAIRMQRTGRKGHAQFRVIVQDSRFSPSSGRIVAYLGSYDPHSKKAQVDKDKVADYLKNGAQPSDRVSKILKAEGIALPGWVSESAPRERSIRHPQKLKRNRPDEPVEETPEAQPEETEAVPEEAAEEPAPAAEAPAEENETEAEKPTTPEPEAEEQAPEAES